MIPAFTRKASQIFVFLLILFVVPFAQPWQGADQGGDSLIQSGISLIRPETAAAQPAEAVSPFNIGVVLSDPGDIESFEAEIGRHVDTFLWYQSMEQTLDTDQLTQVAAGGRIIQLSWEAIPKYSPGPVDPSLYRLKNFTRGDHDSEIRRWARELRDFGYPVLFRPMCEMNGDWIPWSGIANGNSPADYIPAWRHIHDIFMEERAYNVDWLWSPNRDGSTADAISTFDNYYPGDAYVDYIGLSGYNWGSMYSTATWVSRWQDFEEVFGYSYDVLASRTSKPIVLSEMATTELGGGTRPSG